jgi:hypothetical protein
MKYAKNFDCWEYNSHTTRSNSVDIIAHSVLMDMVMFDGIAIARGPKVIFDPPFLSSAVAGEGVAGGLGTVSRSISFCGECCLVLGPPEGHARLPQAGMGIRQGQ